MTFMSFPLKTSWLTDNSPEHSRPKHVKHGISSVDLTDNDDVLILLRRTMVSYLFYST